MRDLSYASSIEAKLANMTTGDYWPEADREMEMAGGAPSPAIAITSPSPSPPKAVTRWTIVGKHLWCYERRCRPSERMRTAKGMGCLECDGCESGCEAATNRTLDVG